MFVLVLLSDTLEVPPHRFKNEIEALKSQINEKYGDKVLPNIGLCITLYDLVELGDSFIYPSEGSVHIKVKFRMVVFRPFKGEILVGRVRSCTEQGVYISLGFFEDVFVQAEDLPAPQVYEREEQLWVWQYETEEGVHPLWVERDEDFRFRVQSVQFNPPPRQKKFKKKVNLEAEAIMQAGTESAAKAKHNKDDEEAEIEPLPRMVIIGSAAEDGLGMVKWWAQTSENDDDQAS